MTDLKVPRNDDEHLFDDLEIRCLGLELPDEYLEEANKRQIG